MATTMYDVIMDLPLLQGISRAQVSAFLEKTHVEFINVAEGGNIRAADTEIDSLLYVITGSVKVLWRNKSGDMSIEFRQGAHSLLGASNLFGMVRRSPFSVEALTPTSLLRIDKAQYLSLLHTQPVYLLNLLNYLSLRAQKPLEILGARKDGSPLTSLRAWVGIVTPSNATDIVVNISDEKFAKYLNLDINTLRRRLFNLQRSGLVELGKDTIAIPSRDGLIGTATS